MDVRVFAYLTTFYMRHLIVPLLALIHISMAYGQHTFQAIVQDAETKEPLVGATAMLEGTTLGGSADASGRVTITDIPSGGQVILFSFVGYQTLKDTFEFPLSSTQPVTVLLSSEGTEAEQLPAW